MQIWLFFPEETEEMDWQWSTANKKKHALKEMVREHYIKDYSLKKKKAWYSKSYTLVSLNFCKNQLSQVFPRLLQK